MPRSHTSERNNTPPMRRVALLLGLSLAVLPACGARAAATPPATAAPSGMPNFNILPGNQNAGRPIKRYFSFTLAPGQSLSDSLAVVNPSRTNSLTVRLQVADGLTAAQGGGLSFSGHQGTVLHAASGSSRSWHRSAPASAG